MFTSLTFASYHGRCEEIAPAESRSRAVSAHRRGDYGEQALGPEGERMAIEHAEFEHPLSPSGFAVAPSHAGQHLSPKLQRSCDSSQA